MVAQADYLLVESTYGNRVHEKDDNGEVLAGLIRETANKGGKMIIPAFAIGRVEELLYWIKRLEDEKKIPVLPVFVDSPMASAALARYSDRVQELDPELQPETVDQIAPHGPASHEPRDRRRQQARQERDVCVFCTDRFRTIGSPQESKELTASRAPSIVISASGMATGGRVLHHLKAALPDARNTVLFAGFQAIGTRGRRLVDGEQTVKIHGQIIPVKAKIAKIDSMSAHADSKEILHWLRGFQAPPKMTFLVHGEPDAMQALKATITSELGWNTHAPAWKETVDLK
jgi:metallo-beta-lactamase family protein